MKKFNLWVLTLVLLLTFGCKEDDINGIVPVDCQTQDLAGTWIWAFKNGKPVPSQNIQISVMNADGGQTIWSIKGNEWVSEESTFSVDEGVLTIKDEFNIVSLDNRMLIIENKKDKNRYKAEKVISKNRERMFGSWTCDTLRLENTDIYNCKYIYGDSVYTFFADFGGKKDSLTGKYFLLNDFLFYQSQYAGCYYIKSEMSKNGPVLNKCIIKDDGSMVQSVLKRNPMVNFNVSEIEIEGIWMSTDLDGEIIPIEERIFFEFKSGGKPTVSMMKDNKWVTIEAKNFSIGNGLMNIDKDSLKIYYSDPCVLVVRNQTSGKLCTLKRIENKDQYTEKILGYWCNDSATTKDGETVNFKFYVTADTIYSSMDDVKIKCNYKLYGEYLVLYNGELGTIFPIELGYDSERGERFMKHIFYNNLQPISTILYMPNLEQKLDGSWIFVKEGDGTILKTSEYSINLYDSKNHKNTEILFENGYEEIIIDSYTIEKNIIKYDDPDYPYDEILNIDEQTLLIRDFLGDEYLAYRLNYPNPLAQAIVGEWYCESFNEETESISKLTHIFHNNGMVTVKENGVEKFNGTYSIYGRLLVIYMVEKVILWDIKDGIIENNSMTVFRRIEKDGGLAEIENILTKVK